MNKIDMHWWYFQKLLLNLHKKFLLQMETDEIHETRTTWNRTSFLKSLRVWMKALFSQWQSPHWLLCLLRFYFGGCSNMDFWFDRLYLFIDYDLIVNIIGVVDKWAYIHSLFIMNQGTIRKIQTIINNREIQILGFGHGPALVYGGLSHTESWTLLSYSEV